MNNSPEANTIEEAFKVVCNFCQNYPTVHGGLPSNDPGAMSAYESLETIKQWLVSRFAATQTTQIEIRVSRGAGAFPRVPWIVMLPPGQKTNAGIYVAMCFGKEGAGAVVGCAQSVTNPQGLTTITRTRRGETPPIDVDGSIRGTHYNNAFANPLEVYAANFDFQTLERHMSTSIALALTSLGTVFSHWIFQGNPRLFDMDQYLNNREQIRWVVRQHRPDVHVGDKVLIWRAGENSGVVATCVVQSEPDDLLEHDASELWYQQPREVDARCKLNILDKFTENPITREQITGILPALSIIRNAQGTNFPLSTTEYAAIMALQLTDASSSFPELLRHYCDENIIYRSSIEKRRYAIVSYDTIGVTIARLDAEEPHNITFAEANRLLQRVEKAGTINLFEFSSISAVRNTIVQAEPLALTADRKSVAFVPDNDLRLTSLLATLENLRQADPHYKPVMLLCALDGIDQQDLLENRITFDWIAPRFITKMSSIGRTVTENEAAQPFYHLSSDLFWMHAAANIQDLMKEGSEGPAAARKKIRYALFKQTYWSLLQNPAARAAVRHKLEQLIMPTTDPPLPPPVQERGFTEICGAFERDCSEVMKVSSQSILRLTSALLSKRFVIFTGLAGSGKTQLAHALAKWLCPPASGVLWQNAAYTVVPVGADWVGNENILGYANGLIDDSFISRPTLELILQAADNPSLPHFLILDEMNLSHVERYFADILSTIESDAGLTLYPGAMDKRDSWRKTGASRLVPPRLERLPGNLFIIGTVNVDETTYMFSPKVLDRATVLEFRMRSTDLQSFLANPSRPGLEKLDGKGTAFGGAFVQAARAFVALPDDAKPVYEAEMLLFFRVLQIYGAEFGYRTAYEAARFIHFYKRLGNYAEDATEWLAGALDCIVVQKLLPKLHGSRASLGPLLKALWFLCVKDDEARGRDPLQAAEDASRSTETITDPKPEIPPGAPYPVSAEKISRMWRLLDNNGFTSFAEA